MTPGTEEVFQLIVNNNNVKYPFTYYILVLHSRTCYHLMANLCLNHIKKNQLKVFMVDTVNDRKMFYCDEG